MRGWKKSQSRKLNLFQYEMEKLCYSLALWSMDLQNLRIQRCPHLEYLQQVAQLVKIEKHIIKLLVKIEKRIIQICHEAGKCLEKPHSYYQYYFNTVFIYFIIDNPSTILFHILLKWNFTDKKTIMKASKISDNRTTRSTRQVHGPKNIKMHLLGGWTVIEILLHCSSGGRIPCKTQIKTA